MPTTRSDRANRRAARLRHNVDLHGDGDKDELAARAKEREREW